MSSNNLPVVQNLSALPVISGEAYQHMGRYAGAVVLSVFEQIGGVNRMAAWADSNPTDFFTKVLMKVVQRSQQVEHSGSLTIDDAITRLERMDEPVDADFEEAEFSYDL